MGGKIKQAPESIRAPIKPLNSSKNGIEFANT